MAWPRPILAPKEGSAPAGHRMATASQMRIRGWLRDPRGWLREQQRELLSFQQAHHVCQTDLYKTREAAKGALSVLRQTNRKTVSPF